MNCISKWNITRKAKLLKDTNLIWIRTQNKTRTLFYWSNQKFKWTDMKKNRLPFFLKKNKKSFQERHIFYEEGCVTRNSLLSRRASPLFLFLFILPLIFVYLFYTKKATDEIFKSGLLLFLEFGILVIDVWIKSWFSRNKVMLVWFSEIPIVILILFSVYVSF